VLVDRETILRQLFEGLMESEGPYEAMWHLDKLIASLEFYWYELDQSTSLSTDKKEPKWFAPFRERMKDI